MRILLLIALLFLTVPAHAQGRANENLEADVKVSQQRLLFDCLASPSVACVTQMAYNAALGIEDPFLRVYTLGEVADAQGYPEVHQGEPRPATVEDVSAARRTLTAALEASESIQDTSGPAKVRRVQALGIVAEGLSRFGDDAAARQTFARAVEIVPDIELARFRGRALGAIAVSQAKSGNVAAAKQSFAQALEISENSGETDWKTRAFSAIAEAQVGTGDIAGARETLLRMADAGVRTEDLRRVAVSVVQTQAEAGEFEAALETAESIEDVSGRARAFHIVGHVQYQEGGDIKVVKRIIAKALATAQSIEPTGDIGWALRDIAKEIADLGDIPAGLKIAQSIKEYPARQRALRDVIESLVDVGDFAGAFDNVIRIEDLHSRVQSFRTIAEAQFETGDTAGAEQTLARALDTILRMEDRYLRAVTLCGIAETKFDMGAIAAAHQLIVGALDTARSIGAPHLRGRALATVAETQAELGDVAGALDTIQSISAAVMRARALIRLSEARAIAGE